MSVRGAIIAGCGAFVAGIALSWAAPTDATWSVVLPALLPGAAGVALAMAARRVQGAGRSTRGVLAALLLGLAGGWVRHRAAVVSPEREWARIELAADGSAHIAAAALSEAARPRLQLQVAPPADLEVRLVGELELRVPERDDEGRPLADRRGRWWTLRGTIGVTSDVITVRAGERAGRVWTLATPFSRLTGIEVVRGTGPARFVVRRSLNEVASFARSGERQAPLRLIGRVSGDPVVYDFKTVLPVLPQFIEWPAGGTWMQVEGGLVHVTVRPEMPDYARLSSSAAYGRLVEVVGALQLPGGAANPGGFDPRRHLRAGGVQAVMFPAARGGEAPVRLLPAGGEERAPYRSSWVAFSLDLRDRLTRVIKETIPFPASAFVGAVTLGLRYGLQNVPCLLQAPGPFGGCPEFIADEFRAAGISHVLAVSGLHVTILTVMFVGLFSAIRLPRQVYTPLVLAALVVFAIVTGARPSTLRAVIMNGLMLLSWAYLHAGLRASVLLGAPVAAALILAHNPLVLTDPSFTLSFGAILSLGLLTPPVLERLETLRGPRLAAALALGLPAAALAILRWPLVTTPQFWGPALLLGTMVWRAGVILERRGVRGPDWFALGRLPAPLLTFFAAQCAIQIGMMIPLSAYYFARWPLAGAWANLIAIPLIGVIVQLGAIGGLVGLVPGVGIWLSLVLGAANWLASTLFLVLGHVAAATCPYPFVRQPGGWFLWAWYGLCALFVWWRPLREWAVARLAAWQLRPAWVDGVARCLVAALVLVAAAALRPARLERPRLTFLAVGYGGATLIETPSGRRVLVDAGPADPARPWRNEAIRTVLPFLSSRGIRRLDALVLTSPRPERAGGAGWLLDHLWVRELWRPPAFEGIDLGLSVESLAVQFGLPIDSPLAALMHATLVGNPGRYARPSLARALRARAGGALNRWAGWATRVRTARAGEVILRESTPTGEFRIEVLHAALPGTPSPDAGSVVLRVVHGDAVALLTSDLSPADLAQALAGAGGLARADLISAPHHGAPPIPAADRAGAERELEPGLRRVLELTGADVVVAEFGRSSGMPGASTRQREMLVELARQLVQQHLGPGAWFTTATGAVVAESDGRRWMPRAAGAGDIEEDDGTDLMWGL
ncbi:MAG: ComEC/Rec2 family competence protein [Kiritimatiellae bacterium]|nr:ComEC/Rec2 family competence protein [Kiritimatiellia bacterium]